MTVSVIIPIYNAEKYLPDLFRKLEANHFEDGDEILLVDNGSTDSSFNMCQKQVAEAPKLYRLLSFTEKAGSYAARNYAVRESKGQVLVFTDSDTKPVADWLCNIRTMLKPGMVIAGEIELEIISKSLWELYDNLAHLNSEKNAFNNRVATANMSVYRADFDKVGFFEERFSGGDYDWSIRAKAAGLDMVFVQNVKVYHPTRKTFEQVLKKEQRIAYGVGNHYNFSRKPLAVLILKYFAKIFKIDTNVRYHKALKELGVSRKDLREFDRKFWIIRIEQLKYAVRGYKMVDARKLGVK